jgi:HD-GYP domain-containing protein (c-di-GMP phosphodiesterase class II)
MLQLVPLPRGSLSVGIPLAWHIYDVTGTRILNKGDIIGSQEAMNRLMAQGIYGRRDKVLHKTELDSASSTLSQLADIQDTLDECLHAIVNRSSKDAEARIMPLAASLMELCAQHPDMALRWIHVDKCTHYVISHALHMAIIVALIAQRIDLPLTKRQATISAALTANVSLLDIQDQLNAQKSPLSMEQRQLIEQHPERSADLLRHAQVNHDDWLEIVLLHHEKLDGTGYPLGMKGDNLSIMARLVALADAYTAMLSKRGYREERVPQAALKELFLLRGEQLDNSLVEMFIKEIGLYPPGSLVKLVNGEIAVVTKRGKDARYPVVQVLLDQNEHAFHYPIERDTAAHSEFRVQKILRTDALAKLLKQN